jgi:hypothetical protein
MKLQLLESKELYGWSSLWSRRKFRRAHRAGYERKLESDGEDEENEI